MPREIAPVPGIVRLLLVGVVGLSEGEREDKTHWLVPFRYQGIQCLFAHEKFGLFFYAEHRANAAEILDAVMRRLGRCAEVLEGESKPFIQEQIAAGRITVVNRFQPMAGQYRYFRDRATAAYADSKVVPAQAAARAGR